MRDVGAIPSGFSMPALAAILIHAAATAISIATVGSIGRTGWTPRWTTAATFVATLLLPICTADARVLESKLPKPGEGAAVVVLRLRGRHEPGAMPIEVIDGYARRVEAAGGLLFLSELGENAMTQLRPTRKIGVCDKVEIYPVTENVDDATGRGHSPAGKRRDRQ